jgi:5-formyltetrahydrofolate cyclo-ligase
METHAFGYRQPVAGSDLTPPTSIDVWIVPGAAFDTRGNRLGHGKGYYDRLLSKARPDSRFIAVTLGRRIFDRIPTEAHDVTMHRIVTEERVITP